MKSANAPGNALAEKASTRALSTLRARPPVTVAPAAGSRPTGSNTRLGLQKQRH